MRIGVNALFLIPGGVGGTEVYLRRMVEELEALGSGHEFIVFTNRETGRLGRQCVELPLHASYRSARILYEQFVFPRVLKRERIDVLFNPGYTGPLWPGVPQVTVFHDLQHKRHPEFFRWYDLPFWQFFLWASAKRSKLLIAVSEATRYDLMHYYGLPSVVVSHGVEEAFFRMGEMREDRGYLLCASTTHPHKNHERLLRVFGRLRKEYPDLRLVLTGVRGFVTESVEAMVRVLGLESAVELKGWLPREELYEVFRCARGFVYPSRFEGFGMPPIEALAAGLPVACSNIEPLRSLTAGTAILFNPDSDESMLHALRRLMDGDAPRGGRERAAQFTWGRTARETLRVIEDGLR